MTLAVAVQEMGMGGQMYDRESAMNMVAGGLPPRHLLSAAR